MAASGLTSHPRGSVVRIRDQYVIIKAGKGAGTSDDQIGSHAEYFVIILIHGNDWRSWHHLSISGLDSHQDVPSILGQTNNTTPSPENHDPTSRHARTMVADCASEV